jgi:hypothetical protein
MTVMHVENQDITRDSLARLLGVKDGKLGEHRYVSTGVVGAAKRELAGGAVKVVVLDLGLNPAWDNHHMRAVLRHLALNEAPSGAAAAGECEAHVLAMLAHQHKVRCALLTNYADYTGGNPPLTHDKIAAAFHAEAVFSKDEAGQQACARWVKQAPGM